MSSTLELKSCCSWGYVGGCKTGTVSQWSSRRPGCVRRTSPANTQIQIHKYNWKTGFRIHLDVVIRHVQLLAHRRRHIVPEQGQIVSCVPSWFRPRTFKQVLGSDIIFLSSVQFEDGLTSRNQMLTIPRIYLDYLDRRGRRKPLARVSS